MASNRMANAQLLMYAFVWVEAFGAEFLFFFFFLLNNCEYHAVLSDLEIPPDLKIGVLCDPVYPGGAILKKHLQVPEPPTSIYI